MGALSLPAAGTVHPRKRAQPLRETFPRSKQTLSQCLRKLKVDSSMTRMVIIVKMCPPNQFTHPVPLTPSTGLPPVWDRHPRRSILFSCSAPKPCPCFPVHPVHPVHSFFAKHIFVNKSPSLRASLFSRESPPEYPQRLLDLPNRTSPGCEFFLDTGKELNRAGGTTRLRGIGHRRRPGHRPARQGCCSSLLWARNAAEDVRLMADKVKVCRCFATPTASSTSLS